MKTFSKTAIIIAGIFCITAADAKTQTSVDLDIMSRYVWRGTDFGNSPSIQPGVSYAFGNFEIGGWAAIATTGNPAGSEIDWFASYSLDLGGSSLEFMLTDYTFPEDPSGGYFQPEAHFLEFGVGYEGPESFPVSLSAGVFLTNDDDYSMYTELGYSISSFDVFVGLTPAKSEVYGTGKAGVINSGIRTGREVRVTDNFSLSLTSAAIMNFYDNNAFFLIGISL